MNNFDDLFEQQPQPEATEKPEPQKEKPKKQWWQIREEKQRKEAYATLDRVFGAFSEGHGDMKAYLDTQSRFPFHSARNAILIGEQCPNAKRVGGYKEWASQGVEILEEEKRLPIIILEPGKAYRREDGSVGQNFYAKEVFDISQTTARDEAQPQVSYDDRLLLKALISNSPVPIRAVEAIVIPIAIILRFLPSLKQDAIYIKQGMKTRGVGLSFWRVLSHPAQTYEGFLIPILMRLLMTATELSASAETRGISYPCKKTHYILVDFRLRDGLLLIGMLALFAVVIWTSFQPISF